MREKVCQFLVKRINRVIDPYLKENKKINNEVLTKQDRIVLSKVLFLLTPLLFIFSPEIVSGIIRNNFRSIILKLFPYRIITMPYSSFWLMITSFIFPPKTQKDTFEPIVGDWQEEYFEALFKKEVWKARWINVRYSYEFIMAMWQKSPIGDLIEFVSKLAK